MGLDMYLTKKIYIGGQWDHSNVKGIIEIESEGKLIKIEPKEIEEICVHLGTWRKANHIHKWFVDHCQDGEDDCREAYVSEEDLNTLLDDCKTVLRESKLEKGKVVQHYTVGENCKMIPSFIDGKVIGDNTTAKEILPTQSGFFFGSEDYNEWYLQDIEYTIGVIEKALSDKRHGSIYYKSSW